MGTLAIGISLILVVYALFLHITHLYFLGNANCKGLYLKGIFKKLKEFLKSTNHMGRFQKH